MLNDIELTICEMQGQLFELSAKEDYGSLEFIKKFMKSKTAYDIDKPFDHMQWAGEGYIIDRVDEEDSPVKGGEIYDINKCLRVRGSPGGLNETRCAVP